MARIRYTIGLIALLLALNVQGQQRQYFPSTDSIRKFTDRFIRTSALDAFNNLRLNTVIKGLSQAVDSAGGKDTLSTRLKGMVFEQANPLKIYSNPKVSGVKSVAELRTVSGLVATDTQFLWKLTDFTRKFTQDYQLDFSDVTTADDGGLTIVAGTRRFKAVIRDFIDARLFGIAASISNNAPFLQAAVTAAAAYPGTHTVLIANGTYPITSTVTIPSNVTLRFVEGGIISGSGTLSGGIIDGPMRAQLFTTTLTVHADAVASMWSMKWGGAAGSGSVDDQAALQWCWTMCAYANKIKHIWWPAGTYRVDKGLIFERDDNADGARDFLTGYTIEGESKSFGGSGEVMVNVNNVNSFGLDFQKCKGFHIYNIGLTGKDVGLAALSVTDVMENPSTNWDNGCRANILSPHIGFATDAIGTSSMIAGDKYPDFTASYSDASNAGCSDMTFEHCMAQYFIVGFGASVSGIQNGDAINYNYCWATANKYCFVTGSSQNRSNKLYQCKVWGNAYAVLDSRTFGDNVANPFEVEELNVAGYVKYLCVLNSFANNGMIINNSHFELLWSLGGNFTSESGKLTINNTTINLSGSHVFGGVALHPPKTTFRGNTLNLTNCTFGYYTSGSGPIAVAAIHANFVSTGLDNIVINNLNGAAATSFDKCTGVGGILPFGDGNRIQKIAPIAISNNQIIFSTDMEYIPEFSAGDFYVSLTRKKVNRTLGQFGYGGKDFQQISIGAFTPSNIVAYNAPQASSTADITLTPGSTALLILKVGDHLLTTATDEYGRAGVLTEMGEIYAINTGTGVVSLRATMIGLSAIAYSVWLYRPHQLIPTFAVGTATSGSNVITDVVQETVATQFPTGAPINSNYFPEGTYIKTYNSGTRELTVSNNATSSATLMDIIASDWQMVQYGYPNTALADRLGYKQGDVIWNKRPDLNADVLFFVCTKSGVTGSTRLPEFRAFYKNMAPPLANDAAADVWATTFYYNTTTSKHRIKNGGVWSDIPTTTATDFYTTDGTLSSNRSVAGNGKSLSLGTVGSNLTNLVVNGTGMTDLNTALVLSVDVFSGDAIHTVPANVIEVELNDGSLTANRVLTLPTATINGTALIVINKGNNASFFYTFGSTVTDNSTAATVTNIAHKTTYFLHYDSGLGWRIILKY